MWFAVFANLSRRLTTQERTTLFEALDATVPDSGCVGPQNSQNDEVYFSVDAQSEAVARARPSSTLKQS